MIGRLLLTCVALPAAGILLACGGDGGEQGLPSSGSVATATAARQTPYTNTPYPTSNAGTVGGPEPVLGIPAAQYSLLLTEVPSANYQPNPPNTFIINSARFALSGLFSSGLNATAKIQEWGFIEGWNSQYDPLGQLSAVVNGAHYVTSETYLFETPAGAKEAYAAFLNQYTRAPGSQAATVKQLGNESAGFTYDSGQTIGAANLPNVYHRFLFRRGNMVAVVQVNGGGPYVSIDMARDYSVLIDQKALGERPATLPTPIPTAQIAVPTGTP